MELRKMVASPKCPGLNSTDCEYAMSHDTRKLDIKINLLVPLLRIGRLFLDYPGGSQCNPRYPLK